MRVLITNDDGVDSPGIHELAVHVERAGYDAIVVAPDHNASGTGTSVGGMSSDKPIDITPSSIKGFSGEVYGIAGPPALCVLAGYMQAFGPTPDIIVSGINAGLNPGRSVTHSGTVGAALAGQNFGMRSIAVSVDAVTPWHWFSAASLTVDVLAELIEGPSHTALNLNVPGLPLDQIKGIRWASLAPYGSSRGTMVRRDNLLVMTNEPTGYEPEQHTDIGTVRAGYAALTSIHGSVEVWGDEGKAGEVFHADHGIHAASAGHETRAGRATFVPARYDPDTYKPEHG
jgi:5'-nucleotidase